MLAYTHGYVAAVAAWTPCGIDGALDEWSESPQWGAVALRESGWSTGQVFLPVFRGFPPLAPGVGIL